MKQSEANSHAIEIEGLSYRYPMLETPILRDINLTIGVGEFVLLMGSTGGGKSTLSLCLNGVIPRMLGGNLQGTIHVLGSSPREEDIYQMATKIGLVFQDADSQICNIFVRDEVGFGAQNLLVPKDIVLERISRVLRFVGLEQYEHRPVFNLSGGEKQRLAIASVLAMEPGVIVFDEPTANLDPQGALEVQSLIRELRGRGVTIIVIEHDISKFVDMADRLIVLDNGGTIYNGPPRQILREYGFAMRDELGLRIPQVAEFALEAERRGSSMEDLPLSIDELRLERYTFRAKAMKARMANQTKPRKANPAIEAENLSFSYRDGPQVLKDVSMKVFRGEILAILGRNGSGKTTLTSQFIGINKPTSGQLSVCGMDAAKASIRDLSRKVSYVFQYPEHQFVTDTVLREMLFGLSRHGLSREESEQRAMEMLEMFQLNQAKDRHPFTLSRGQKRRLSVACMLVMKPDVFILDEPTTGQDQRNINQVMEFLRKLNEEGLTIILVTHDMELVIQYAHRVIVLEAGKVMFEGTPWELFSQELLEKQQYGLSIPGILEIYRRLMADHPWMPPPKSPCELAEWIGEG